jgi:Ca2+-binding RTX toxin-like protein
MRRVRAAVPCALLGLLAAAWAAPPAATAGAGVATCHGRPATIVGHPGETVAGTAGDDVIVIVSDGGDWVDAGDGNDTICLRGRVDLTWYVDAGPGDDYVDSSALGAAPTPTLVLGDGTDVMRGGPAAEVVSSFDSGEPDDIRTAGGDDDVRSQVLEGENTDVVSLGAGDDRLTYEGTPHPDASFDGGTGKNRFVAPDDSLNVDNVRHRFYGSDEATYASISGFNAFFLPMVNGATFIGGPRAEWVSAPLRLTAVMGGGNDRVKVGLDGLVDIEGGPGRDTVDIGGSRTLGRSDVLVDLARERIRVRSEGFSSGGRLAVENVIVRRARTLTLIGDEKANRLFSLFGCDSDIRGGGGADLLLAGSNDCLGRVTTLRGDAGDDVLVGREGRDWIVGGSGIDRADGRGGKDHCVAEIRRHCELH